MGSTEQRILGLKRGLALLGRTRSRDDRRVMLGYLLRDLEALREAIATAPRPLRQTYAQLAARARQWRAKLGAPVAPDADPPKPADTQQSKKERPHASTEEKGDPDPGDGAPKAATPSRQ